MNLSNARVENIDWREVSKKVALIEYDQLNGSHSPSLALVNTLIEKVSHLFGMNITCFYEQDRKVELTEREKDLFTCLELLDEFPVFEKTNRVGQANVYLSLKEVQIHIQANFDFLIENQKILKEWIETKSVRISFDYENLIIRVRG